MAKRIVSLILLLAMALPVICITPVMAEDVPPPRPRAKLIAQHDSVWFGRPYVEIEMNGVVYKTDDGSVTVNRQLFDWLSEEDKGQLLKTYGSYMDRYHHFGSTGEKDIVDWAGLNTDWKKAADIWHDRIAKKNFPELFEFYETKSEEVAFSYNGIGFTMKELMSGYGDIRLDFRSEATKQDKLYDDCMFQWVRFCTARDYGKACYDALKSSKVTQTQTAIKTLSKGVLDMIVNNLLIPTFTPRSTVMFTGPISDAAVLAIDVSSRLIGISDMLYSTNDPDPMDVINAMWEIVRINEETARDMEVIARESLTNLRGLLSQLDQKDEINAREFDERYEKSAAKFGEMIDTSKIDAFEYGFVPTSENPAEMYDEAKKYIDGQLEDIGAFDLGDLAVKNGAVTKIIDGGTPANVGGYPGKIAKISKNGYPFYTEHSNEPIFADDDCSYYDFAEILGIMDSYTADLNRKNDGLKELIDIVDGLVWDYQDKIARWKGLDDLGTKYGVNSDSSNNISYAKTKMNNSKDIIVNYIGDGESPAEADINLNTRTVQNVTRNKAAFSGNREKYEGFYQVNNVKYETQRNNYEAELIYYERKWKELCALREGFRFYNEDAAANRSENYDWPLKLIIDSIKDDINDGEFELDNSVKIAKLKKIANEIDIFLKEELKLCEILQNTQSRALAERQATETIMGTIGMNEKLPAVSFHDRDGGDKPTTYLHELRSICLGENRRFFWIEEAIDELYNNFGKWREKVKTEEGLAELNRIQHLVYTYDFSHYRECVGDYGFKCYWEKQRDLMYGGVFDPIGPYKDGPYFWYLYYRLRNPERPQPDYIPVTGVSVSPASVSLGLGDSRQINVFVTPADATRQNVSWVSADSNIASVSDIGVVTAVSPGSTKIYVYSGDSDDIYASTAVTVTNDPPDWLADAERDGDTVAVTVTNSTGAPIPPSNLIVSAYNGKGKAAEIQSVGLPALGAGESEDVTVEFDYYPANYRLFLWDEDMKPLGSTYIVY